jgi:hypothetical protein
MKRHPLPGVRDQEISTLEPMDGVHYESSKSDAIGVPVAYDLGIQRFRQAGHLITDWMGDDGFLKRLDARCKLFSVFGDTQTLKRTVVKERQEGDKHLVNIEIRAEDQRGENAMPGRATVSLPLRCAWI